MTYLHRWRILVSAAFLLSLVWSLIPAPKAEAANQRWCPFPDRPTICSENAFLDYWKNVDQQTGSYALDILGFPITPALYDEPDGLIVQFYERAIFEWHPENPLQYQVLLTRLGALSIDVDTHLGLKQEAAAPPRPCENTNTCYIFNQTQHTLRGSFLNYWTSNGGLPVFGLALTEQFQLEDAKGVVYTVQYFERNRFEAHPENSNPRYQVLLGRLGAEELNRGWEVIKNWPIVRTPNYGETATAPPPASPPPSSPSPSPSAPPASSDQALVDTATNLIYGVPDARYIVDNLRAKQVKWTFASLQGAWGKYSSQTNLITYNPQLRSMDPHDLAAVTGHEGQHAYDYFTYGPTKSGDDCYIREYRGFLAGAALWEAWYGPSGKAKPVNDFEREANHILDLLQHNPDAFEEWLRQTYADHCGAMAASTTSKGATGAPRSSAGLPDVVRILLPQADDLLVHFDSAAVRPITEGSDLPVRGKQ